MSAERTPKGRGPAEGRATVHLTMAQALLRVPGRAVR